ncbi:zf-TFIIB domain-containing protein [Pseudofrankia asymbiotica]|uniref:Zf-TFIIB domain containing protein n=1 Tax=Pseudofrankia asymbiotica TaxID=1834516 RepID=A0A1V2IBF5_9ACTN|nr:zf-TFIIB domain-containing protein [Pseudofrankia asymbiotica]ONH30415.1 zf-TFIIB domain containing protein [Pseudofrankia asymbiotica]
MQCPKCHAVMRTYNRNGVQIEQCDGCRGIFLDYGELETLTRLESQWTQSAPPAPPPPPAQPYGQPAYGQPAYGQPAYGQPAYGQPAWGHGGHGRGHGRHGQGGFFNMLFSS